MFWKYFCDGFLSCYGFAKLNMSTKRNFLEDYFINIAEYFTKSYKQVVGKYERS